MIYILAVQFIRRIEAKKLLVHLYLLALWTSLGSFEYNLFMLSAQQCLEI